MTKITMFGKGNMGQAIGRSFEQAGNIVRYFASKDLVDDIGDIVVLAVPYQAALEIAKEQRERLTAKIVIDISNPLNFETFDELVVPSDSSAAQEIAALLPDTTVVKGFNTNFASTLSSKKLGTNHPVVVQLATDDEKAVEVIRKALEGSGLQVINAGKLKRARELEAMGFLQMTLAASEQISWNGGFGIFQ